MTPNEFDNLNEREKADTVEKGEYIADRSGEDHKIRLYKIGSLYVEVCYNKEHNVIMKFNAFSSSELLDIYGIKNTEKKERTLKEISKEMQQKRIAALNDLNKHDKSN